MVFRSLWPRIRRKGHDIKWYSVTQVLALIQCLVCLLCLELVVWQLYDQVEAHGIPYRDEGRRERGADKVTARLAAIG